jgi:preprotein translocase subunit SecE
LANLEDTSVQDGTEQQENDEDRVRERSLQLGGTGPNLAFLNKYTGFLSDVWMEMKKVSWPTRRQVITETIVVLVVLVFFSVLITALDRGFGFAFNALLFGK